MIQTDVFWITIILGHPKPTDKPNALSPSTSPSVIIHRDNSGNPVPVI